MSTRLDKPNDSGGNTDHSLEIWELREKAKRKERYDALVYTLVADLLQAHDESGIALDDWSAARDLVEMLIGEPILESGI